MKGIEERSSELVVACGDCAIDLEVADHALDAVSRAIQALVPANDGGAGGFCWDDLPDAIGPEFGADGIGVVALVREKIGGLHLGKCGDVLERRAVRRFAGGEMEGERDASGVTETMNFTGEPAPRPAKSLFASPPFAPAAET